MSVARRVETHPSRASVSPQAVARHESTGLSAASAASAASGSRDKVRVILLSGVAGFIDAAGFLALAGLFPAHITGELVTEALALSSDQPSTGPSRLWMPPVFVLAVAVAAVVARFQRKAHRAPLPALLLLVAVGLASFAISGGVLLAFPQAGGGLVSWLSGCCAVAAMGFQNALMRASMNGSAPTTFMTGNLTQFVIELVDRAFAFRRASGGPGEVECPVSRSRFRTAGTALAAFLASAILGGVLTRSMGAACAILPTVLVGFMSAQAFREQRLKPAASEAARTIGMRRPTPIHRPLEKLLRPQSGTRFKAVRPPEEPGQESA